MISDPTQETRQLDHDALRAFVERKWNDEIVPALTDYIAVPAKSPAFDPQWAQHGYLERVVRDAAQWVEQQPVRGLKLEIVRLEGRTPVIFFDAPATRSGSDETVVLYGHLDKQPEFAGWRNDLGPWTPKLEDGRLYGRGGADDGYAIYASVTALAALDAQGIERPRCVGLIETCEESGSYDLLPYVDALRDRLGNVGLVVCLDSGAGNYDQLWLTTSLRGLVSGDLEVEVLEEGIHSGSYGGIAPSSFRVMRQLFERLEDASSGNLLPKGFHCPIPSQRLREAEATAQILGDSVWKSMPWACGQEGRPVLPTTTDPQQALLNSTWRPSLSVTGAAGLPALENAGNVLRPRTAFKLSLRLPPLVDAAKAVADLKALLEVDPPYNAKVTFKPDAGAANGWSAPELAPWLFDALNHASRTHYGADCAYLGQGGTIPLMNVLQAGFPKSQFMVCGVLGPKSNAHGPNEFLHVPYARKLTATVAEVIASAP
ncbi:M20 family metallopeptidase [Paraburkholderia caballeronis]|uniref:M20 family metallopeptidase n=1 Tax=Paraburkholderia caballeronis TaxID=416943 RepID=UPI0010660918|nr:M20 family metallopeptidase [Paraburkholderia caballeronis]TDV13877.1 acetylornithine deacetylase/succinyl-diaminopimelate desuccinylase-like protein [Paraburkholderia caballeronis]TDV15391.1 acetylornithine deacetylase/succinyl-diaminopimelate desuccinylase-like protein [Paraburkholderia caballeronis]TDV24858.1 acetylornithine deacetylase/succinyl-diaminopimelate desuccinylase-like protein [Paraburkholderia caballeronis]TDV38957.1 acetylornithine deacetylase/succinyl-diaminopimelate desucci